MGDSQSAGLGTRLQETKVRVKPNAMCAIQTARVVNFNEESMLCAHAPNTDACNVSTKCQKNKSIRTINFNTFFSIIY